MQQTLAIIAALLTVIAMLLFALLFSLQTLGLVSYAIVTVVIFYVLFTSNRRN